MKIDRIIRSNRKTIALIIKADGEIYIRAPYQASEKFIAEFIKKKTDWIIEKKALVKQRLLENNNSPKEFIEGREFLFLGKVYQLKISSSLHHITTSDNDLLFPVEMLNNHDYWLTIWYKRQAVNYLGKRTYDLAVQYGFHHTCVKINSAEKRWGSCSHKNSLNFSWKLIMAEPDVIDYVIIHELCHTVIKDHSPLFWKKVAEFTPDYRKYRKWLKDNYSRMKI